MMTTISPSRIIKSDFAIWENKNSYAKNEIYFSENKNSPLRQVSEIVLAENGSYELNCTSESLILIIILYGKIHIENIEKTLDATQVITINSVEKNTVNIKNILEKEPSDILIIEFEKKSEQTSHLIENILLAEKNTLIPISKNIDIPNFIGLYSGRQCEEYLMRTKGNSIFGMVLNGAFEFQNRLMENRDAIVLSEVETLEFEALSENALLLFFEI